MNVFRTPLKVTNERFGRVPRAYIESTQDRALPIERQRAFQERLPCTPVITMETDHSPFYSEPERLAQALMDIEVVS